MVIGDRLKALREQKNMSQGEIEKRTDLLLHRYPGEEALISAPPVIQFGSPMCISAPSFLQYNRTLGL
jgi:transcriptional regulator with XRE-family HTH domain